jgi:hypothetical protein
LTTTSSLRVMFRPAMATGRWAFIFIHRLSGDKSLDQDWYHTQFFSLFVIVSATIQVLQKEVETETIQVTLVHPFCYDSTSHSINNFPPPPPPRLRKKAKYKNCK